MIGKRYLNISGSGSFSGNSNSIGKRALNISGSGSSSYGGSRSGYFGGGGSFGGSGSVGGSGSFVDTEIFKGSGRIGKRALSISGSGSSSYGGSSS